MPLDQTTAIPENYQNILRLARKLRDGDFPPGFTWDYTGCSTCAIEIAVRMFGDGAYLEDFDLSPDDYQRVFHDADVPFGIRMHEVQPEHVAEVIETIVMEHADLRA